MFVHLACLPLAAILINDVRTESSDGALTVDVATSEPMARTDVRGVSGGPRRLFVYLQGTQASRQSFGAGPEAVVVHPRARYTKLEIPTDGRCAEPMSVEATPSGIRLRAACQSSGMPAGLLAPPARLPGKDSANPPSPDTPLAVRVRGQSQSDSLRAALALPVEATDKESDLPSADDIGHRAGVAEIAGKLPPAGAAALVGPGNTAESVAASPDKIVAPVKPAPIAPSSQPDAPTAALASTESPSPTPAGNAGSEGKSSSSTVSTVLAVLLLVGLGVAATILSRRRATRTRMIRIVETASIGPRRSLVVACIGGRTMVLGVSEAGVSLLDAQAGTMTMPPASEKSQSASLEEAALRGFGHAQSQAESAPSAQSTDDGKHEGTLLSRLFHRGQPTVETAGRAHEFDELLAESLDDQELRRKLSLGEAGRVA